MYTSTEKFISLFALDENEAGDTSNSLQKPIDESKHFFSTYEWIKHIKHYQTLMSDDKNGEQMRVQNKR